LNYVGGPFLPFVGFVAVTGFLAVYLYLRAVLRRADPGRGGVVPDRVRDTLNTVVEGVLVLDRDERIAPAHEAFARALGRSAAELRGRKASDLPWRQPRTGEAPEDYPWRRALREGGRQMGVILELHAEATHQISPQRQQGDTGTPRKPPVRTVSVNSTS